MTGCAVLFSWAIAIFPGEIQFPPDWDKGRSVVMLYDRLFNAKPDEVTGRRFPFSSTLVLPGLIVYEGLGIDDPNKVKWRDFVFRARRRDLRGAIFALASLPKVDFEGADLRGALLQGAQLQGASLQGAQLQGASLAYAQLQGASLFNAQLQGALLEITNLQGALLADAQLQGASLKGAQLEGAALDYAQLQGASLQLAQLQGTRFDDAQLQGAIFTGTVLEATDFTRAFLWRTWQTYSSVASVRMSDANWLPEWRDDFRTQPWDDGAYQILRNSLESLPEGNTHNGALQRVQVLDCSSADQTRASCVRGISPPPEAEAWRKQLEAASVGGQTYAEALAKVLEELVCARDQNAIYVLRGRGFQSRLVDAGSAASGLIDEFMNKDTKTCPVAAALTDADRASLLWDKQRFEAAKQPGGLNGQK